VPEKGCFFNRFQHGDHGDTESTEKKQKNHANPCHSAPSSVGARCAVPLRTPPGDAKTHARRTPIRRHCWLNPESRSVNFRRKAPQNFLSSVFCPLISVLRFGVRRLAAAFSPGVGAARAGHCGSLLPHRQSGGKPPHSIRCPPPGGLRRAPVLSGAKRRKTPPSPLAGEGWGEGATASKNQTDERDFPVGANCVRPSACNKRVAKSWAESGRTQFAPTLLHQRAGEKERPRKI
jgi:hypothetical protein